MALNKALTNDQGVVTNYHKVSRVNLVDGRLSCSIDSYVSKDYREAGKPADSSSFRFRVTLEEEESMGIRALCYKKIKELDDWKDAEDC
jgi:hypothetical protein